MFTFRLALRNFLKHIVYSFITLFGLTAGFTATLILLTFGYQVLTFDQMHPDHSSTFMVYKERATPDGSQSVYDTWVPLLKALKEDHPAIEDGTRVLEQPMFIDIGKNSFRETVMFADEPILSMFSLPLKNDAGLKKSTALITEDFAKKYFGDHDPLGQSLQLRLGSDQIQVVVAAVMEDIPQNSTIRPSVLVSFEDAYSFTGVSDEDWGSSYLFTFVKLKSGTSASELETVFRSFVVKQFSKETADRMLLKLLPLKEWNNTQTDSRRFAFIALTIAFIILMIASVNYINLSIVRSLERAKEIGLRKVMGAQRGGLVWQFLCEAFAFCALAFILSIGLSQLTIPYLNSLLNTTLSLSILTDPVFIAACIITVLLVAVLSGSAPAYFIVRFHPIESLKGKIKSSRGGVLFRKTLVTVQFTLAILLLGGTFIIRDQIRFMKTADAGFEKENIIVVPTNIDEFADSERTQERLAAIRAELLAYPSIVSVSASSDVPADLSHSGRTLVIPEGWTEEQPFRILRMFTDESYFATYGIPLLQGQMFSEQLSQQQDTSVTSLVILNESAMKAFGWTQAEGKRVGTRMVVGVVADHHYGSLAAPVEPILFVYRPFKNAQTNFVSIRYKAGDTGSLLKLLEQKWKPLDESRPFFYYFTENKYDQLYAQDDRNHAMIMMFSIIAVVLGGLGLFALTSYAVESRTKEISIRKILGASYAQLSLLISNEFLLLIAIAWIIASPIVYFVMQSWLSQFAVRTTIHYSPFITSALVIFIIAIAIISSRIWKVVTVNPVNSLKDE